MNINKATYDALKKAYKEALAENKESFVFEGQTFLVGYAKYLLEYLELPENARKINS